MHRRHAALGTVGVLVAVILAVGLSPAVLAQEEDGSSGDEASFGAQVSSFMQSTAADAEGSVDRGMWQASVEGTDSPSQAIGDRAASLEQRVQTLRESSQSLVSQRESGELSGVAYAARASKVRVRIANLRESIEAAAGVAESRGVDAGQLAEARQAAGSLEGPAVAEVAREIADAGDNGGPGDAGPADAGSGDAGPGDAGPGDGGPGDAGPGDAGSGDGGPDDAQSSGQGASDRNGGQPDGTGPENGNGPPDGIPGGDKLP